MERPLITQSLCSLSRNFKMAAHVLCVLLIISQVVSGNEQYKNDGIMNKISNGMKFAQDFLGK